MWTWMMTSLLTEEVWAKVPNVDYLYASNIGRVCSEPYLTKMPKGGYKTNQLKPTYGFTQTHKNYSRKIIVFRRKTYRVATLVAAAFLGPRPEGFDVSHKDENSFNNCESNLCYETRKKNLNRPKIKEYHSKVCRQKMTA